MSKAIVSNLNGQASGLDALTERVREGARRIIAQALEAKLQELLASISLALPGGKRSVVRNGYLPEMDILTGAGPVTVRVPKVRDRLGRGIKFTSRLVPPYLKRAERIEVFLPRCCTYAECPPATSLKHLRPFAVLEQKGCQPIPSVG